MPDSPRPVTAHRRRLPRLAIVPLVAGLAIVPPPADPTAPPPAASPGVPARGPAPLPPTLAAPARRPPPDEIVETCTTAGCHADLVDRPFVHGPAAQDKCLACHAWVEPRDHAFRIVGDPVTLCSTCHERTSRTFAHAPFAEGDCIGCHDPHGSAHPRILHDDPARDLCRRCHVDPAPMPFVHGPVESGACILCHEAHDAWSPKLLVAPSPELCLSCHAEMRADPVRSPHRHAPVESDCLTCHDAHASRHPHQLVAESPELCAECHADTIESARHLARPHGALAMTGGCETCHAPHFAVVEPLRRAREIDACLACHDRTIRTADGRTLADMGALLRENPDQHGPVRDGSCTACHAPHGADEAFLLRRPYPPEFYAAYEPDRYALCFECHLPDLVRTAAGTGLTGFRDGDLNLHWLHVNRDKGRTCRACHEVHASKHPFHMRDSVPYGSWELEIGFVPAADGGSCAPGCHAPRDYDRSRMRAVETRAAAEGGD